jgi:DNA-binding response OmpR family regulator
MRVLVVDDEPDVLLLCRVNFEFAGHEVIETDNAEAALSMATSEQPDLIVLDVMLPNRDGLSILEELAEQPETRQVPVVLLTAKTQEHDRLEGYQAVEAIYSMTPAERERRRDLAVSQLGDAS